MAKMFRKKVYGIGLPRTGSTSLSKALEILGYEGIHKCILHPDSKEINAKVNTPFICTSVGGRNAARSSDTYKSYSIDNRYWKNYQDIYKWEPDAFFILTTRDATSWNKSTEKFNVDCFATVKRNRTCKLNKIPYISDYQNEVDVFFYNNPSNYLNFDIFQGDGWKELCKFLHEDVPRWKYFPKVLKENE